jgi:DNA-binding XRE family transcriptional regulator
MEELANRLKEARSSLNLSQDYVAKLLNVNRTSIVQIE